MNMFGAVGQTNWMQQVRATGLTSWKKPIQPSTEWQHDLPVRLPLRPPSSQFRLSNCSNNFSWTCYKLGLVWRWLGLSHRNTIPIGTIANSIGCKCIFSTGLTTCLLCLKYVICSDTCFMQICMFRFRANGNTMRSLWFNFLTGRSTAGMIVRETCAALWERLQPIYVRLPQTPEEWKKVTSFRFAFLLHRRFTVLTTEHLAFVQLLWFYTHFPCAPVWWLFKYVEFLHLLHL